MSWDVSIFWIPPGVATVDDLPYDYEPRSLGSADQVLRRLTGALPAVDLSDPTWGFLEGPSWIIELNIGADDPVRSIMLHVRGGGDDVLPVISRIADVLRAGALDCSTGELLTGGPDDNAGWHGFQTFRDSHLNTDAP